MNSAKNCRKALASLILLAFSGLHATSTHAVRLDFTAFVVNGSCDFELDRTHVVLRPILTSEVVADTLVAPEKVTLAVKNCTMKGVSGPVIKVTGAGMSLDQWVYRNTSSTIKNTGIRLVQSSTPPDFSSKAVSPYDPLTVRASSGTIPDQEFPLYVALTCGNSMTCATTSHGVVTANIEFTLDFP